MKKLFWILGGLVLSGIFAAAYTFIVSPRISVPETQPAQSVGFPVAGSVPVDTTVTQTQQSSMTLEGVGGQFISTVDFIADPMTVKDPSNPGYYYLGYHYRANEGVVDATATDNPPYIIEYIAETHYFNISLLSEPIGELRQEAEQYLMTRLGITQDQMCQLDYMVSVPDRVNSYYSGKSLGFSFCQGATALPR